MISPEAKKFVKTRQNSDVVPQKAMLSYAAARAKKAETKSTAKEKETLDTAKSGRRYYVNSAGDKVYIK